MKRFQLGVFGIVILLVFITPMAKAAEVEIIHVEPLQKNTLTINLRDGHRFSGSLSISGGGGNDIDFWIVDPVGVRILDYGRVYQGMEFNFKADKDGAYILNFDNTFSLLSTKTVTLSYNLEYRPLILGLDAFLLLFLIVTIVVIVGVAVYLYQGTKVKEKELRNAVRPK